MEQSRIKNTKRNIIFSYIDTIITMVFAFVSRSIIVHVLGDEYLGLSSLFSSILQVLNMAELGFSSAIVYNMYKPLAEGDTVKVRALLNYYRKIYRIVGITVLVVGTAISPFLPKLIHGEIPPDVNLYVLYFLFLANTGLSYLLFAYKTALLESLQRMDLTKIAYSIVNIVQHILQIVVLFCFKNYYLFVVIIILATVAKNLFTAWIARKKFPQYFCAGTIDEPTRKDIIRRVKGLLIGNISSVTYTTLDSIILSSFVGLTAVAIYNNYYTICSSVLMMVALIRGAMQASVGNSVATESIEKNYEDMLLWQFLFSVISGWCVTCMASLFQPFMTLWMGPDRLLGMMDVVLLCMWFFVIIAQHACFVYLSGTGAWWEMRWPYILSTVCNLVLNIVLGKTWGITGILFASFFSSTVFGLIWQVAILFRLYFKKSMKQFQLRELTYFCVSAAAAAGAYFLNSQIPVDGIPGLIVRGAVCTVVFAAAAFIAYSRTDICRRAVAFTKKALKRS